jgi:glutaredoxin 3
MPPVLIYTKPFCPFCARAVQLLKKKGVAFTEIDDAAFDNSKKTEMLQKSNGRSTFPQIFVGDTHVGGCDDLMQLEASGALDKLLAA